MSKGKRQQHKRAGRRSTPTQTGRVAPPAVVEAYGGWVVSGDGRTVVGQCRCGEAAVVDCPECGPQCQRCFIRGG
jgi:hypothetical protein